VKTLARFSFWRADFEEAFFLNPDDRCLQRMVAVFVIRSGIVLGSLVAANERWR
jgi:hypothetical protein